MQIGFKGGKLTATAENISDVGVIWALAQDSKTIERAPYRRACVHGCGKKVKGNHGQATHSRACPNNK